MISGSERLRNFLRLKGRYYDGTSARSHEVRIELTAEGLLRPEPPLFEPVAVSAVQISSRVGNTPRRILLPAGGVIETADHELVDRLLVADPARHNLVHRLERSMAWALGALLSVVLAVVIGAVSGVPWISRIIAYALPVDVNRYLSEGTLEYLDEEFFLASAAAEDRREALQQRFETLLPLDREGFRFHLEFRDGGVIGANAFALPDGTVVVTDQLLLLSGSDDEVATVLLHEVGHVVHRHGLRILISHMGLSALTIALTGDVSAAGSLVVALPNLLMQSAYSRDLEWEADTYALEKMKVLGLPGRHFAALLDRMEHCQVFENPEDEDASDAHVYCAGDEEDQLEPDASAGTTAFEDEAESDVAAETTAAYDEDEEESPGWFSYVSTHPPTRERLARFRAVGD